MTKAEAQNVLAAVKSALAEMANELKAQADYAEVLLEDLDAVSAVLEAE